MRREATPGDYGVGVPHDAHVDEKATKTLRSARVQDNIRADLDNGPGRNAWEAVFDDKIMEVLNKRIYGLPNYIL